MTAREFLESVREAALDAARCDRQAKALEGLRDSPMTARRRQDLTARIERDESIVSEGAELLRKYGEAGGDVREVDALWWRFIQALDWRHVARALNLGVSQSRLYVQRAMDGIDTAHLL